MVDWRRYFLDRHRDDGPSVLVMDRVGCYSNPTVLRQLQETHIKPCLLPPQASKLISPCDTSFLASLKARLRGLDTSTTEAKEAAFLRICGEYDPEVMHMTLSTGDANSKRPRDHKLSKKCVSICTLSISEKMATLAFKFVGIYPSVISEGNDLIRGNVEAADEDRPCFKGTRRKLNVLRGGHGQRPKARESSIGKEAGDRLRHIKKHWDRRVIFKKWNEILVLKR
jgi:hypothetical protein